MRNNRKVYHYLLLIMCVLISTLFVACDNLLFSDKNTNFEEEVKNLPIVVQLQTPKTLSLRSKQQNPNYSSANDLLVMTNENASAFSYDFYFYTGSDYNNTSLYTMFPSEVPYIKLTDVINKMGENNTNLLPFGAQRYYCYCIYRGGTDADGVIFTNSKPTEIKYLDFKGKVSTPEIFINTIDKKISWTKVENADKYILSEFKILTTNEFGYPLTYEIKSVHEFDNTINEYDFSEDITIERQINYFVQAVSTSDYYLSSEISLTNQKNNYVSYVEHITLQTPQNVILTSRNVLKWDKVENATTYSVYVDNDTENPIIVDTNSLNVAKYLKTLGTHNFYVMTNAYGNYLSTNSPSNTVYKLITEKLDTPKNATAVQNQQNVIINWDSVKNAVTYTLMVNDKIVSKNISTTTFSYYIGSLSQDVNTVKYSVCANGYGYYEQSEFCTEKSLNFVRTLQTPENLTCIEDVEKQTVKLSFEGHPFDKEYLIYVGDVNYVTTKATISYDEHQNPIYTQTVDITTLMTEKMLYDITIKSLGYTNFNESEYSDIVTYRNKVKFKTPEITDIYLDINDDDKIIIEWENIEYCSQYALKINGEQVADYFSTNKAIISKTDYPELNDESIIDNYNYGYIFSVQAIVHTFDEYMNEYVLPEENKNVYCLDYLDYYSSTPGINTFYPGFDSVITPTLPQVEKLDLGIYKITWNEVKGANGYYLAINNDIYDTTLNEHIAYLSSEMPYQIKLASYNNKFTSDYTEKVMINNIPETKVVEGYTDKYYYFNEWHDYLVTNSYEYHNMFKYHFMNYSTKMTFYTSYITPNNFIYESMMALDDFGTYSIYFEGEITPTQIGDIIYNEVTVTIGYTNSTPPTSYNLPTSRTFTEAQTYYKAKTTTRDENYNNFVTETSLIEMEVSNTNLLYMCAESQAKPKFAEENYQAKTVYEECKKILREIISDSMTDFEKALAIYDYINYISVYDYGAVLDDNTHGSRYWVEGPILYNIGVCDGFAKLYSLMCNMEGIVNRKITGKTASGGGHAWNKIALDLDYDGVKEWYAVDLTWDGNTLMDRDIESLELMTHKYFLKIDSEFGINHIANVDNCPTPKEAIDYYDLFTFDTIKDYDLNITSIGEFSAYLTYLFNNKEIMNGRDIKVDINGYDVQTAFNQASFNSGIPNLTLFTAGGCTFVSIIEEVTE